MSDLIDRQRAIEAVKLGITYAKLIDTETGELLEPSSNDELKRAVQRIKNLPSAQQTFDARDTQYNLPIGTDCISRQQAIDAISCDITITGRRNAELVAETIGTFADRIKKLPSAEPYTIHSDGRLWVTVDDIDKVTAVVVDEHKSKFCKQFYEDYEDAQPEIIRCKDCKHFEYDHVENVSGIPLIVAHEICMRWGNGDGVKTSENGYCFLAERRQHEINRC